MMNGKTDLAIGGTIPQKINSCIEQLDLLLTTPEPIVACMVVAEKKSNDSSDNDIIAILTNIMNIKDIKSISLDAKLSEVGMDSLLAAEINQVLERDFEISLPIQELRTITFNQLKEKAKSSRSVGAEVKSVQETTVHQGMQQLNLIEKNLGDEKMSMERIIRLKNGQDHVESVLFIPGIEGVYAEIWGKIAEKLLLPAYMLQLRKTGYMIEASQIAETVLKEVLKVAFNETHYFRIVGYSFGSIVAIEVARILESLGMKGKLILIDGAPDFLKKIIILLNQNRPELTDQNVREIFVTVMKPITTYAKLNIENPVQNWDQYSKGFIEIVAKTYEYTEGYVREIFDSVLTRIKVMMNGVKVTETSLESNILLIRPTQSVTVMEEKDYALSNYTKGEVTVKFLDGDHSTLLENPELVTIINDDINSNN